MFGRPTRVTPLMPTQHYKTYALRAPLSTHFRRATCAEVACEAYVNGFTIPVGVDPEVEYIARNSGKSFREVDGASFGLPGKYLVFEPGQSCFEESTHVTSLERPEFYYVGRGDHRSFSTRNARLHTSADNWQDDMANHLDKIRTAIERG